MITTTPKLENLIFKNLLKTEPYLRKVLPFLKPDYFQDQSDRLLFSLIHDFVEKYNTAPTTDALIIEVGSLKIDEDQNKAILSTLSDIKADTTVTTPEWMIDETEKFCKHKAAYQCVLKSIDILKGNSPLKEDAIPEMMKEAVSISFDTNVGHDFLEGFKDRFEYYHAVEEKIPFDLDFFNKITNGGVLKGTLNVLIAGTGGGKSLAMSHFAAAALAQGKNVLYLTMELSEKELAKRIDANLMDIAIDDLLALPEDMYEKKAQVLKQRINGKLIIKQYPTSMPSAQHFRSLLNELRQKKGFKPDVVFVDYLNICASSRLKRGQANSYEYVKAIAEELRGLAVEWDFPMWTATQLNRTGFDSSDPDMDNTADSFGLPMTADFMCALVSSEELEKLGQLVVKQLKNRYKDPSINKRFVIGVNKGKMKLFDVTPGQQNIQGANQPSPVPIIPNKFTGLKVA